MSGNTSETNVKVTGDATGAQVAMRQASAAVQDNVAKIRDQFDGLQSVFNKVNTAMLAIGTILAGGAAFRDAINTTVNLTKESQELGKQLGKTASETSVLTMALGDAYVSTDKAQTAVNKITQALRTNEDAFAGLGVATRDANGNYRNSIDIMLDVNSALSNIKEGTDRNIEGQKLYGRSWSDVSDTLRMTRQSIADAQDKAESLGMVVGERSVAQTNAYRAAMNDVDDVMAAIKKAVGDALLPVLTRLGNWFSSIGPSAVTVMKNAMLGLVIAIESISAAFQTAWAIISGIVQELTVALLSVADAMSKALRGDFSGAAAALQAGGEQMVQIAKEKAQKIADAFKGAQSNVSDAMSGAWDKDTATSSGGSAATGTSSGADTTKPRTGEWETQLTEMKSAYQAQQAAEGSFREFSKSQEVEYWNNILATTRTSTEEKRAIRQKVATLELAIQKSAFEAEIADLKMQQAAVASNYDAKLALAQQVAQKMKAAYGDDSKEYAQAQQQIIAIERQKAASLAEIAQIEANTKREAALSDIDARQESARLATALGEQTNAKLLEQEAGFESERYAIQQQALAERIALAETDPTKSPEQMAALHAEMEALELQHETNMNTIANEAAMERAQYQQDLTSRLASSWATLIMQFKLGTTTMAQAMKALTQSVTQALLQMLAQYLAKKIAVTAADMILGKKSLLITAAQAAANAAKSAAQIPFVGWALALGAAAAVFAGVKAMSSAAGGYDIPAGVNPVTQLHAKEMVLPAKHADVIRAMADGGGQAGRPPQPINQYSIQAMDASSFESFLKSNPDALAKGIKHAYRDGHNI